MHALDLLGDPVRRRILELLADGEQAAGALGTVVQSEFGISQPAVSQHLRVLRQSGFVRVRAQGTRRLYAVDAEPLRQVDAWLDRYRGLWNQRLDALATELARGRHERGADPSEKPARSAGHGDSIERTQSAHSTQTIESTQTTQTTQTTESRGPDNR